MRNICKARLIAMQQQQQQNDRSITKVRQGRIGVARREKKWENEAFVKSTWRQMPVVCKDKSWYTRRGRKKKKRFAWANTFGPHVCISNSPYAQLQRISHKNVERKWKQWRKKKTENERPTATTSGEPIYRADEQRKRKDEENSLFNIIMSKSPHSFIVKQWQWRRRTHFHNFLYRLRLPFH